MGEEEITAEKLRKDWKTFKFYKRTLISIVLGIISGGGAMLAVWEGYSKPQMQEMIRENNISQDSLHSSEAEASWNELAKLRRVPEQIVVIDLFMTIDSLTRMMHDAQVYRPFLERESKRWRVGEFSDENGEKKWSGWDWRDHGIVWDNGRPWVIYNGAQYYYRE